MNFNHPIHIFWETPQTFSLPHPSIQQDTAERTVASGEKARGAAHRLFHPRAGQVLPVGLLAYSYLKNREEALDAVQTAVCRAWERQDSLRDPSALHTWFCRILVNACTDLLRQRGRVTYVPLEDLEEGGYEDPLPADDSLAARVDALPPEVAAVIRLRFYEELSLKEISAVTGAPLSTVKTRLYTGLKKLRVSLEGVYDL